MLELKGTNLSFYTWGPERSNNLHKVMYTVAGSGLNPRSPVSGASVFAFKTLHLEMTHSWLLLLQHMNFPDS